MSKKILNLCLLILFTIPLFAIDESQSNSTDTFSDSTVQMAMSNADYMVTPGDVYVLSFSTGSSVMQYQTVVDTSYKIRVANLAVLDATGKSFISLKRQVEDLVARNYPMSGVQFALAKPAVFNVIVKGEVPQTVEQSAWALSRLSTVAEQNMTAYSSIRDVTVTSANGVSKHYDLYSAKRNGDLSQNPYLRPGDVITLRKFHKRVSISGAVRRGGTYELLEGENLKDLIDTYADGFDETADKKRITISRVINGSDKSGSVMYLEDPVKIANFELNTYDSIFVDSLTNAKPVMYMEGAILKPNTNQDEEGATKVEGTMRVAVQFDYDTNYVYFVKAHRDWLGSAIADLQNAFIIRGEELIPFDISKALYDANFTSDLIVQPNDILRVPMKQYFVSVAGSVSLPGRYPYIPNKTYDYYIGLAGGFNKTMNKGKAVEIIDAEGNKLTKNSEITPETTITAETNSFLFYFNQYAPVITTILSIISTSLSIMAVTGIFNQ